MENGLVGHTGFVGGNLARQREYESTFHRATINDIDGRCFSRLVISAASAEKWRANANPEGDAKAIRDLVSHLRTTRAEQAVLISTIDVYPRPQRVDEGEIPSPTDHTQAYGRNRLELENFVREHYPVPLIVRLPALFGTGLRKNLIFDLMNGREEEFCHRDSVFQFYDLSRLDADIETALGAGIDVMNLATEPISAADIASKVFGRELTRTDITPATYDMRTRHAEAYGLVGVPYLMDRVAVLGALGQFVGRTPPWSSTCTSQ